MRRVAIPKGTGHYTQVVAPAFAGMCACLKSGGVLQHLPSLCHGYSAPMVMLNLSVIAASKAVVSFRLRQRNPLKTLASGLLYGHQLSANSRRHLLFVSVNRRCHQLRVSAHDQHQKLLVSAKVPLRPVLPIKACSLPGRHQLPLVATGETVKQNHRVFAARPAARAVRGYDHLLL